MAKSQLEKALPWLIGGGAVLGLVALSGQADASIKPLDVVVSDPTANMSPNSSSSISSSSSSAQDDGWGYNAAPAASPAQSGNEASSFGADGLPYSTRVNSKAAPSNHVDYSFFEAPLTPPYLFPVPGGKISKGFGWDMGGNTWRRHIEISAPAGTQILMPEAGTVKGVESGYCGYTLSLRLNPPVNTQYEVLMYISCVQNPQVGAGGVANRGQILGYTGSTAINIIMANEPSGYQEFDPGPWIGLGGFRGFHFRPGLAGPGMPWHEAPAFGGYYQRWEYVPGIGKMLVMRPTHGYGVKNWYRR